MKILLATGIYPPDAGGPATYTRALARSLHKEGVHHAEVVCYGAHDTTTLEDGFRVYRIGRDRNMLTRYWKYMMTVKRLAKHADRVYLQGPVSEGLPGTVGALLARKPTIMKIVGDYAWEIYQGIGGTELLDAFLLTRHSGKIGLLERIERWTAKRAKRVIVPSQYLASVVRAWGVSAERISVIENAAEPLPDGRTREIAREDFDVAENRVMLTAIRCVPWKHIDFLIDILRDLPSDVILVVAGDGPSLAAWYAKAQSLGVFSRVRFLGRVDRATVADWYRAADLFALPSAYEGFPHVVPEAASVGLPSIVSDKGGNPETRDLLGASLVTVLPHLDRAAWVNVLASSWPTRNNGATPDVLQFETMVNRTVRAVIV